VTIERLEAIGISPGWRCLELGAGGGSVAAWMARRVAGPGRGRTSGEVLATDVDTRFLDELTEPNLTVLRHDAARDPLPEERFDLVHARFLLEHLPEREEVLDRVLRSMAPGAALVVQSIASFPIASSPHRDFRRAMASLERVLARTIGTDSRWGRSFPAPLQRRGLVDVGAAIHLPVTGGANASATCWALTLAQLRPRMLELGLSDAPTLDRAERLLADEAFFDFAFATAIAWGRKPERPRRSPRQRTCVSQS
jgi:SAM-dependent methyltransferase